MIKCKIKAVGSYFPEKVIFNETIAPRVGSSDKWIIDKIGIKQRHCVSPDEHASDLGYRAALDVLHNANLEVDDIDLIITVTSSPDRISPSTACLIQEKLSPTNPIPSFDINAVCTGFLYALEVASPLCEKYNNILVVAAETYSRWTDYTNKNCVFFGDGAGAVILTKSTTGWYYGNIFADGSGKENFTIQHGETFKMNGKEVYKVGTTVLPQAINKVLKFLDMSIDEIDYFVPHQPSFRILLKTAETIGLPIDKIVMNMDKRGNTAGASIPTALDSLITHTQLKDNDKILFAAVGSGWTWGAGVMNWRSSDE